MPRSAKSPVDNSGYERVYLSNCPFKEKDDAKSAGAKWDAKEGSWYVSSSQHLECFNRWHPKNRKYLECNYDEKDDAKRAGARWDASCRQWYIGVNMDESKFIRWLPSSSLSSKTITGKTPKKAETKSRPATSPLKTPKKTKSQPATTPGNTPQKTKSQLATIPRINDDMTVTQLRTECRARDPSIKGLSSKNKSWLLDHLKIGTPWISAESIEKNIRKSGSGPVAVATSGPKSEQSKEKKTSTTTKSNIKTNADKNQSQSNSKKSTTPKRQTTAPPPEEKMVDAKVDTDKKKPSESNSKKSGTGSKKRVADVIADNINTKQCSKKAKKELKSAKKDSASTKKAPKPAPKPVEEDHSHSPPKRAHPEPSKNKKNIADNKGKVNGTNITNTAVTSQIMKPASKKITMVDADAVEGPILPLNVVSYSRITSKMTMAKLWNEAKARQLDSMTTIKLKSDLLRVLVEGSICVHESPEYIAYQNLLKRIQTERTALYEASLQKQNALDARREKLREQRDAKAEQKRAEKHANEEQKRVEEECQREERRCKEITQQETLHIHMFPRVHIHALARHDELMMNGVPRKGTCDICYRGRMMCFSFRVSHPVYSCDKCDWDVCQTCFDKENMSEAEKEQIRVEQQLAQSEQYRKEEEERKKEEEEYERRWNAQKRFKSSIIKVEGKHLNPKSRLKFTVWCSDGYDNDGWHSYEGEPSKEFDSMWNTKKEANDRAEYLFFWKNPWGNEPSEVNDSADCMGDIAPESSDGLKKWSVSPEDSSRWTVGVVPANAFIHLSNSSICRHSLDCDRTERDDTYDLSSL